MGICFVQICNDCSTDTKQPGLAAAEGGRFRFTWKGLVSTFSRRVTGSRSMQIICSTNRGKVRRAQRCNTMGGAQPDGLGEETFSNQLAGLAATPRVNTLKDNAVPLSLHFYFHMTNHRKNNLGERGSLFLPRDLITPIKKEVAQRENE